MIDPKLLRVDLEKVKKGVENKKVNIDFGKLIEIEKARREIIVDVEKLKAERNKRSSLISKKKKNGEDVTSDILETRQLGGEIKKLQDRLIEVEASFREICLSIPNLPHASVPIGHNQNDNVVVRTWGQPKQADFPLKDHLELGESLALFDFARGAKISGRGFPVFTGLGAKLERALINFFLDTHIKNGFKEILPPHLVNRTAMTCTGQLPKMEEDMYRLEKDDLFLIPTAEVPVTNLHAGETLLPTQLPISYVAYSPCFRREAGSWGKETRGFQRLHQFNKVEMVQIVDPEKSYESLQDLVQFAENLLQTLGLHYRVLELCSGDLSFAAAKCFDLEVFSPATRSWLEVSSVSNFEDFQARRANIRMKRFGKPQLLHTLNGSGLATPRTLVALIETYQLKNGGLAIPRALQKYMDGLEEIKPGQIFKE